MTIQEIENMTFAELKARQSELIGAMKDTLPTELAARYVQARLDAKQRDEKLSEQGRTITNLNAALQTRAEQLAIADRALTDEKAAVVKLQDQREQLAQEPHSKRTGKWPSDVNASSSKPIGSRKS